MDKLGSFAKKVDWVAKFLQVLSLGMGVILLLFLVLALVYDESFYSSMNFTVDLISVKFHFIDECIPDAATMKTYCLAWLLIGCWGLWVRFFEIDTIRKIIKRMIEKRPFDDSVAKNIRKLSLIILIGDGVGACAEHGIRIWEYHAFDYENIFLSDKLVGVSSDYNLSVSFVWMFLIVYLLSYVFQYGQELQIQSDETL